jgi:hypothetical protein
MTRGDLRATIALETARMMEEPTAADQARVYAALKQRILAAPVEGGSAGPRLALRGLRLGAGSGGAKLSQLALVAALSGGIGYWLGLDHSAAPRDAEPTITPSALASGEAPEQAPRATGLTSARSEAGLAPRTDIAHVRPSEPSANAGADAAAAPASEARASALAAPPGGSRKERSLRRSRVQSRAAHSPAAEDRSFFEAVRLLQRADRAVQNGQAGFAITLLDELDARFPDRILSEERAAMRVLAACASGDIAGARAAASKIPSGSGSIYDERIERSCVARSETSEQSLEPQGSKH